VRSVLAGHASFLALLVDLAEERLIELELLSIHLALCVFVLLLVNLLLKELRVLVVDLLDLLVEAPLLLIIIVLVARPNLSLLIMVVLRVAFAGLLLLHLLVEEHAHLVLLFFLGLESAHLLGALTQVLLHLVLLQVQVFLRLLLVLALDNGSGHSVHELLSALLTGQELAVAVVLLLSDDAHVLLLGLHVPLNLALLLLLLLFLVHLVLDEHLF
jgi:hypothetical protein